MRELLEKLMAEGFKQEKDLKIMIKKVDDGYVIIDEEGKYPMEGKILKTKEEAEKAIEAMYGDKVWNLRKVGDYYLISAGDKEELYADTANGIFDMTWEDIVLLCQNNSSSSFEEEMFYDKDGAGYSLEDIARIEGLEVEGDEDEGYTLSKYSDAKVKSESQKKN